MAILCTGDLTVDRRPDARSRVWFCLENESACAFFTSKEGSWTGNIIPVSTLNVLQRSYTIIYYYYYRHHHHRRRHYHNVFCSCCGIVYLISLCCFSSSYCFCKWPLSCWIYTLINKNRKLNYYCIIDNEFATLSFYTNIVKFIKFRS